MIRPLSSALALTAFWLAAQSIAQPSFNLVVDSSTPFPGTANPFTIFDPPAIADGVIGFEGRAGTVAGVFHWKNGVLTKAADYSTTPSGQSKPFNFFGSFTISAGNGLVAFRGAGEGFSGVYQFDGNSLQRVADSTTAIPGGTGNFTTLFATSSHGEGLAFIGQDAEFRRGLFSYQKGSLSTRLAPGTIYPGSGAGILGYSSEVGFDNGNLAFWGSHGPNTNAIFTLVGSTLTKIAERDQTAVPGTTGKFTLLQSPPEISGSKVAFIGSHATGFGLYSANLDGSELTALITSETSIPNGSGGFTGFGAFSFSGEDLVFLGNGSDGQQGIYLLRNGNLSPVIDKNTSLNGKAITSLNFNDSGYTDGELAFSVTFADNSRAIFTTILGELVSGGELSSPTYSPTAGFTFTFTGTPDKTYQIQYSSDPGAAQWSALTTFKYSAPIQINDPDAPSATHRFYRAVVLILLR